MGLNRYVTGNVEPPQEGACQPVLELRLENSQVEIFGFALRLLKVFCCCATTESCSFRTFGCWILTGELIKAGLKLFVCSVVSGTPIQNSLKDLWTLISFLKLKPFTVKEWWNRTIQRPSMMGDPEGFRQVPGGFIFVAGLIFCGYVIDGDMAGKPITVSVKINTGFSKGYVQPH